MSPRSLRANTVLPAPINVIFAIAAGYRPGCCPLAELATENRHARHHLAGIAAGIVRERKRPIVIYPPPLGSFAAQLEPRLEHHPQPRRANRVAEALQAAVGVHRHVTFEVERAGEHLFPRAAPLCELEILVDEELGGR